MTRLPRNIIIDLSGTTKRVEVTDAAGNVAQVYVTATTGHAAYAVHEFTKIVGDRAFTAQVVA